MHTIVKVIMITPKIIEIQFLSVYEFLFCKFFQLSNLLTELWLSKILKTCLLTRLGLHAG